MKLAQFDFLKKTGGNTTPLLLLDDIFDKLDAFRVEQIVKTGSRRSFRADFHYGYQVGIIWIKILKKIEREYKVFAVEDGEVTEKKGNG